VQFHIHDVETLNPFHRREYQNDFRLCSSPYILNARNPSLHGKANALCVVVLLSKAQNLEDFFCQFVRQDRLGIGKHVNI
jgi:hypothetical protein